MAQPDSCPAFELRVMRGLLRNWALAIASAPHTFTASANQMPSESGWAAQTQQQLGVVACQAVKDQRLARMVVASTLRLAAEYLDDAGHGSRWPRIQLSLSLMGAGASCKWAAKYL